MIPEGFIYTTPDEVRKIAATLVRSTSALVLREAADKLVAVSDLVRGTHDPDRDAILRGYVLGLRVAAGGLHEAAHQLDETRSED